MFLNFRLPIYFRRWLDRPRWRLSPCWLIEPRDLPRQTLLKVLAFGRQEGLELTPLLNALAMEHRGAYRRSLKRLIHCLEMGTPLVDALEQTVDVLSDRDVLHLRLASQSGTLNETLQRLAGRSQRPGNQDVRNAFVQAAIYAIVVGVACGLLIIFLNSYIVPVCLQLIEGLSSTEGSGGAVPFFPMLNFRAVVEGAISLLPAVGGLLIILALVWRFTRMDVWLRRRLAWGFSAYQWTHWKADLLELLAETLKSGRPLSGAISTLARYHFNPRFRQRLLLARNEIEHGVPVWQSLEQARLLDREQAKLLSTAGSSELETWVAQRIAEMQRRQLRMVQAGLTPLVQPVIVLVFGGLVLWIGSVFFRYLAFVGQV